MRLVDDQDGQQFGLLNEAGDLGADGAVGGGAGALGGQAELPGDGLVHVEDVAGGEGDVVDAEQAGVEVGGDVSANGGLAAADLAGQQPEAAQLEQMHEARDRFVVGAEGEQFVGLEVGGEGEAGESEVAQIGRIGGHISCPSAGARAADRDRGARGARAAARERGDQVRCGARAGRV